MSNRLDAIAEDAELPEKSEADLRRLAEFLKRTCEEAIKEHNQKLQENATPEGNLLISRRRDILFMHFECSWEIHVEGKLSTANLLCITSLFFNRIILMVYCEWSDLFSNYDET